MAQKVHGGDIIKAPDNDTIDRVRKLVKSGHDVKLIKKDLKRGGYSVEVIEDILHLSEQEPAPENKPDETAEFFSDEILGKTHKDHSGMHHDRKKNEVKVKKEVQHHKPLRDSLSFGEKLFVLLFSVFLFFFLIWISINTSAKPSLVFISFIPLFLTILASIVFFEDGSTRNKIALWIIPLLSCMAFYGVGTSGISPILENLDIANLTVLNFLISMIYILILDLFRQIDEAIVIPAERKIMHEPTGKKITRAKGFSETDRSQQIAITSPKDLYQYFQSIEDKAKAINFVIGRVYSNKKGGSPAIRDKIKIKKEWYNQFSEVTKDNFEKMLPELRDLVYTIGERLNVLWRSELGVFGISAVKKFKFEHDSGGKDRVIDVLIKNDKDPVEVYYQTAVEFCNRAVRDLDSYKTGS